MKLSEEVKNKIIETLNSDYFKKTLYEGLSDEERKELGMVYTPPEICIQMIEKFDCDSLKGKRVLDPTCGSGNLLIACFLAGADEDKLFGNDFSAKAVELCRKRLSAAGADIKDWQIHQGDALIPYCLEEFGDGYDPSNLVRDKGGNVQKTLF